MVDFARASVMRFAAPPAFHAYHDCHGFHPYTHNVLEILSRAGGENHGNHGGHGRSLAFENGPAAPTPTPKKCPLEIFGRG
jgi:hypothetical protein